MIQDRIEQDILIDAPVDVVWKVVTEPDQIEQWFVDKAEIDVREGGAGKLTFVDKEQQTQTAHLQVESIQKPTRFAFKWGFTLDQELTPGKTVLVEFLLVAEGDKTRLTVIESGFSAVEWGENDATQYIKEHTEGWAYFVEKLRDHAVGYDTEVAVETNSEDELWEAVADPSRRRVLDTLLARGELTQSAIASELPFTRQAVAKHLAVLDRAGLVKSQKAGREVRYIIRPERVDDAARVMQAVAARWDKRLNIIKRLAEEAHRQNSEGV